MATWDELAQRSGGHYTVEQFEETAYRLITEQVLYHSDRGSRTAYWMVSQHERPFAAVLDHLGVRLGVNRQLRYAYAIPRHERSAQASQGHTLMALVLRRIYDDVAYQGGMNDKGEVITDTVELGEKYRLLTGRDLPAKGELDSTLRQLRRWGIAQRHAESTSDNYAIAVRPAIVDILGETAIARLTRWSEATATTADVEAEPDSDPADEHLEKDDEA